VLVSVLLFPVHAQSNGLKVIVDNERESGEVCVFSASKTLPCKYLNRGGSEEFQFAPNAIQVGEEFQVCLEDFCMTESNSPENRAEYVTLPISKLEEAWMFVVVMIPPDNNNGIPNTTKSITKIETYWAAS
jgi:hypothetical protein